MKLELGLALALGSAFALNWGFVAQHAASTSLPSLSLKRPLTSLGVLFASSRWLVGFVVGLAGWGLYVAALALSPLSLVQAVSAGGIGFLALLVHFGSSRLGTREWTGVGLGVGGLGLLAMTLGHGATAGHLAHATGAAAWLAGSAVAAALSAFVLGGGSGLGIAAGVLYAAGDVATKAALGEGGRWVFALAVLAAHGLAFVSLQFGFQRAGVLRTAGLSTLLTNAIPIAAGIALFHERLPGGFAGGLRVAAFVLVTICAVVLARPVESEPDAHPERRKASKVATTNRKAQV